MRENMRKLPVTQDLLKKKCFMPALDAWCDGAVTKREGGSQGAGDPIKVFLQLSMSFCAVVLGASGVDCVRTWDQIFAR